MTDTDEILLERRGGLGIVTLNRPKIAQHPVTGHVPGVRSAARRLGQGRERPGAPGAGRDDRAFCAGGDVRAIFDARCQPQSAGDYKADFFRKEYCLIPRLHRLPKPHVALVDSIAMGVGCGVSILMRDEMGRKAAIKCVGRADVRR
jgi:enoyl-CoA hydratase